MRQMYNIPLLSAGLNRRQTRNAITSAEVDPIYRNVSGGLGHYAGQMLPGIFGGGGQGQFSIPPGGGPGPDPVEEEREIELEDLLPGLLPQGPNNPRPAGGWPPDPAAPVPPWWQQQIQQPPSPNDPPPNAVPIDPRAVGGVPGNPHRRDIAVDRLREKLKHLMFPKTKPGYKAPEQPGELF